MVDQNQKAQKIPKIYFHIADIIGILVRPPHKRKITKLNQRNLPFFYKWWNFTIQKLLFAVIDAKKKVKNKALDLEGKLNVVMFIHFSSMHKLNETASTSK